MSKDKEFDFIKALESRSYKPKHKPVAKDIILKIAYENIGTLGNYVIFSGLPKAGKSTFIGAAIASAFSPSDIFSIKIDLSKCSGRPIAFFDTESNEYDFYKNVDRIKNMAGMKVLSDQFHAFFLRMDDASFNMKLIEYYIANFNPAVVVIDGLLDLINNYNDVDESKYVTNWLKMITTKHNVLIIGVLHTGKALNHTLGHFGSMADRYAQSVLEVVKDKENNLFTLKAKMIRAAKDFRDINIEWNGDHYQEIIVREQQKKK